MEPRLYIFDADDTLRRTTVPGQPCPHDFDEWELRPGVRARFRQIPWECDGPFIAVASNQDHVGYGLLSARRARELLVSMLHAAVGPRRPSPFIAFCPHRLEHACYCRKPAPGLLRAAIRHFGVLPSQTLFVGNAPSDAQAAQRAGVNFLHESIFFAPAEGPGKR